MVKFIERSNLKCIPVGSVVVKKEEGALNVYEKTNESEFCPIVSFHRVTSKNASKVKSFLRKYRANTLYICNGGLTYDEKLALPII